MDFCKYYFLIINCFIFDYSLSLSTVVNCFNFYIFKPNSIDAAKANLDKYIVAIKDIEQKAGFIFSQFTQTQKNKLQTTSWEKPKKCDTSRFHTKLF